MYHSITLGNKNTWDDWHLIPTSRPVINPPSVKKSTIDIPGGDGVLNMTSFLAGRPLYGNRTGSWEFYAENGYRDWSQLFSEIMYHIHGRTMRAVLEDDPAYYYEGEFAVNAWKSNKERSSIVIDYDLYPYKRFDLGTGENWLWNSFNFETGVIRDYSNLTVSGSLSVVIVVDMMPVSPVIVASSAMDLSYDGETYGLVSGENRIPELILLQGENSLVFSGNGTVSIRQTGGLL